MPSAGDVIGATELTLKLLKTLLDAIGNVDRKIALGIANKTGTTWKGKNVFFKSGTSDGILPREVETEKAALYDARKTNGPTATGAVGVAAYYMGNGYTLAVLFSVPFDYNLYSNWFDAKVYEGDREANNEMYNDMYYGDPCKGENKWYEDKPIGYDYKMTGYMSSSGSAVLDIIISK